MSPARKVSESPGPSEDVWLHKAVAVRERTISNKGRMFIALLALQYGCQPLLQKACIKGNEINRISLILVTEATKMLLCSAAILSSGAKVYRPMLESWTLTRSLHAAALPAAGYALQNWLAQSAYANLDSLTFNLLNQTKTLFSALCLFLVMGKRQSRMQLLALSLLLAAALLLNAGGGGGTRDVAAVGSEAEDTRRLERLWLGVLPVFGASFLSGLCGAVTQRTLQMGYNSFQLSLELAVYCVASLLVTSMVGGSFFTVDGGRAVLGQGLFRGWTLLACVPVLSQAMGGVFVGQVTKYAGSVQKGFALIAGVLVTAALQSTLEASALTRVNSSDVLLSCPTFNIVCALDRVHWIAAVLVAVGMYLHTSYPHRRRMEETKRLA